MGQSVLPPVPGLRYIRQYFSSSGTFTLPMTAQNKFDALLVSGGGGGGRALNTGSQFWGVGGSGACVYVTEVPCTNGTTLTVTVGGGGAGATAPGSSWYGASGTISSISGIAGNGVSTTINSPTGLAGRPFNFDYNSTYAGTYSNITAFRLQGQGPTQDRNGNIGSGFGSFQKNNGISNSGGARTVFQQFNAIYTTAGGNRNLANTDGVTGGPIPLLSNYLHAAVGGTGTTGGNSSTADSFFAGAGGSSRQGVATVGVGGAGGAGGPTTTGGTVGGTGGNASVNSGAGGGAGGKNSSTITNTGAGGNGGSGFVIIGYWG